MTNSHFYMIIVTIIMLFLSITTPNIYGYMVLNSNLTLPPPFIASVRSYKNSLINLSFNYFLILMANISNSLLHFLKINGIYHLISPLHTPEHNSYAEHRHHHSWNSIYSSLTCPTPASHTTTTYLIIPT